MASEVLAQTSAWEILQVSLTFPEKEGYELIFATIRSSGHNEMIPYAIYYDLANRNVTLQLKPINSTIHTNFWCSAWGLYAKVI